MKLSTVLLLIATLQVLATGVYSQDTDLSLNLGETSVGKLLTEIENQSEFYFLFNQKLVDTERKVTVQMTDKKIEEVLDLVFGPTNISYVVMDRQIVLSPGEYLADIKAALEPEPAQQPRTIAGTVTDQNGEPLPGVSISIKGTTIGTITNAQGEYSLSITSNAEILQFSFMGMKTQEIGIQDQTGIDVVMEQDLIGIDEVVAIGYGTRKKRDLTGSIARADIESFQEQPNLSIVESMHGTIAGLNVGAIDRAGGEPDISIRGRTSISGESDPLIVLDNVIYRGNLIDINPKDIESIDVLKDASAAAIYGSQATNGVIMISTKKRGGAGKDKPLINYSFSYALENPAHDLIPAGPEEFMEKTEIADLYNSRTEASGYLEKNPAWDPTANFKTPQEVIDYQANRTSDWHDLVTQDNMYYQNHNLSLSNIDEYNNYFISVGYAKQNGYMINEDYSRINARINSDNTVTDWMQVGVQSFITSSDYSGQDINLDARYITPYQNAYLENGEYNVYPQGVGVNPLIRSEADHLDKRMNLFGNLYANIDVPFLPGLSYRINLATNYRTTSLYYFQPFASNFQGEGSKSESKGQDLTLDNVITFQRNFNNDHNLDITLVYGWEKRNFNSTTAFASIFSANELGYNSLQVGSSEQQQAISNAWEESSLYNMARIFYSFRNKYMLTGTVRRDGFSGFGEENKIGLFPSLSAAWVLSEESFAGGLDWMDLLKLRISYGSNGNRTVGRYSTLAVVQGGYNYILADGTSVYSRNITSMASPNLRWETTTGINLGIDFGFISSRLSGSIDYYNNNTTNLLYEVDIPAISGFTKFPDNLGKIHNEGIEVSISTLNLNMTDFKWRSNIVFSRNRNQLVELLGFDLDEDGVEDDLVSEGLFIGEPLDAIYTYEVDGKWQVGDEIPSGYDLGANKVVDQNGDGEIDADDKTIIGYREPSYRIGIHNTISYKNWDLRFFINTVQGGKNYYMAADDLLEDRPTTNGWKIWGINVFNYNFPEGLDYWAPENPDGVYQKPNISVSDGIQGSRYIQRNFIRLQNVSLSYNFASNLLRRVHIQNLKLYLSGKNLLTFTKWPGWDPETGIKITPEGFPVIRSYSIGIDLQF
jgi:TonB-linked SusC/RagA family outer membrane protein